MNLSSKLQNVILLLAVCIVSESDAKEQTTRKQWRRPDTTNIALDCALHYTNLPFRGNYKTKDGYFANDYPMLEKVDNKHIVMGFAENRLGRRMVFLHYRRRFKRYPFINVLEYPCYGYSVDENNKSAVSRQIRLLPHDNGDQTASQLQIESGLLFRIDTTLDTECTLFSNDPASWGVFKIDWSLPLEEGYPQMRNGAAVFVYTESGCEIRHETRTAREHLIPCEYPCTNQKFMTIGEITDEHSVKTGFHLYRVDPSFDDKCVIRGLDSAPDVDNGVDGFYYFKNNVVNGFQVLVNTSENTELHMKDDESGFKLLRMCDEDDDKCMGPDEIGSTTENPCLVYPREEASVHKSKLVAIGTFRNIYPFTNCPLYGDTNLLKGNFNVNDGFTRGEPTMSLMASNDDGDAYVLSRADDDNYKIEQNGRTLVGHITASTHPCMDEFGETSTETLVREYPITFDPDFPMSNLTGNIIRIDKRFPDCLLYADAYDFKGYVYYGITDEGLPLLTNGYPTMMIKAVERGNAVRSNARSLLYYAESDDDTDFPSGFRLKDLLSYEIRFLQSNDPYYHLCLDKLGSSLELVDFSLDITGRVFNLDSRRIAENDVFVAPNVCGLIGCGDYSTCSYDSVSGSKCDCSENPNSRSFKTDPKDKLSPCESYALCNPNINDQCGFGVCRYTPCGESSCRHNQTGSHCVCSAGYVQTDPSDPLSPCDITHVNHPCVGSACQYGDCVPHGKNGHWTCSCWEGVNHKDSSDLQSPCNDLEDICSDLKCLSTSCTFSLSEGSKCACDENDNLTWEYIGRPSKCVRKLPDDE